MTEESGVLWSVGSQKSRTQLNTHVQNYCHIIVQRQIKFKTYSKFISYRTPLKRGLNECESKLVNMSSVFKKLVSQLETISF